MNELKPYRAMKDSRVEWLGEVPEHWEVRRLRSLAHITTGYRDTVDKVDDGQYPFFVRSQIVERINSWSFDGEAVLTAGDGAGVAKVFHYASGKFDFHQRVYKFSNFLGVDGRFFLDYFRTTLQFEALAGNAKSTVDSLRRPLLQNFPVVLPPSDEQVAIVRYLDYVDRRVRRLVRAKRKLIALLTEQKQAIIHRAVTRGLDPGGPLKDSGVEWLGELPEHWEVRRNGRLFAQRNETGFPELSVLEVSLRTGVRVRDLGNSGRKQVMSDRSKYKRALTGDIAYNMMRMWQGAVGVAPVDGLISPAYVVARPLPGTEVRYFERLFRTADYKREVDSYSRGIVKDRNRLYWEDFRAMPSCYPPHAEQVEIANYLEAATARIDTAIARANREIELLSEYRTRLISDVVTGKLDVREAVAALPEVDPILGFATS